MDGERFPLCLAWLASRAVDAVSSIVYMLCDSMLLLAVVHDELDYENTFLQIWHLIL